MMEEVVDKRIMSFRELRVYNAAFQTQPDVFVLSKSFPVEEKYSLSDQIRRSSRSIGANIAEAWKKRRCKAHFVSKLTDSAAETSETQHWLLTAFECGYVAADKYNELIRLCNDVESMLGKMIMGTDKWVFRIGN